MATHAQTRKVQNRPYIDQRKVHYGFLVGLHSQDLEFMHTGHTTADGEQWWADVAEYSPGFTVGVLAEFYINSWLAARVMPTLYFGDKRVTFIKEGDAGTTTIQNIKSSYVSLPLHLKMTAERFNNYRPYVSAGINPVMDLSVRKRQPLLLNTFDCYVEVALGCDFYLPFFKLIPELKFSFGLSNLINKDRSDLTDLSLMKYTEAIRSAKGKMISLTFYFE